MRNVHRIIISVVLLGALAACGSDPKKLNPTADGISYTYSDGDDLGKVTDKAEHYCSGFSKTAKLKNISKNDGSQVAIFECS